MVIDINYGHAGEERLVLRVECAEARYLARVEGDYQVELLVTQ